MDLPSIDRRSVVPLYYQIQQGLLSLIRSGKLKPGKAIPSEEDLSRRLRVSRMTARHALKSLCNMGVAYSRRGKGTFVSGMKMEKNFRQVLSFSQEMASRGARPGAKVITFVAVPADPEVAKALQLRPGEQVIRLERVRMADSMPMGIETAHLPLRLFPNLLEQFNPRNSLYETLAQHHGIHIAIADEVVEAGLAGTEEARLLRVSKGSPVFLFTRTSHVETGEPVEFVKAIYRGDRYKMVNRLTRSNLND